MSSTHVFMVVFGVLLLNFVNSLCILVISPLSGMVQVTMVSYLHYRLPFCFGNASTDCAEVIQLHVLPVVYFQFGFPCC